MSLFDLGAPTPAQLITQCWKWSEFFFHHTPVTIAIELDRSVLAVDLVDVNEARAEVGFSKVWIPWVECWHRGAIPLSAARRFVVIPRRGPLTPAFIAPGSQEEAELIDALQRA